MSTMVVSEGNDAKVVGARRRRVGRRERQSDGDCFRGIMVVALGFVVVVQVIVPFRGGARARDHVAGERTVFAQGRRAIT
jgi:hypothetical protein